MFKRFIVKKLQKYVRQYFMQHPEVKLVAVVGSVGKTSTKHAIATLLSERYRVRMHEGNHNSEVSVPLAILGVDFPGSLRNPFTWLGVFRAAKLRIKQPTDVDVIVQELGTDAPGDIAQFGTYLLPDIAVITGVTPEHMEFFGTIEAVAAEEMSVANFSKFVLINRDDVDARFAALETNPNFSTYGTTGAAEYRIEQESFTFDEGYKGTIYAPNFPEPFAVTVRVYGEHSLRPVMGAVATAAQLGLATHEIAKQIAVLRPVPGRMNLLRGMGETVVIDDTYNSSPAAAAAAIQTLYSFDDDNVPQRIVVLGDMRELGATSQAEHEALARLLDSSLLAWVVLVGPESEKYVAPIARQRGCQVHIAKNAIEAGEFVRSVTEPGAVILVKGSQNTIYLEECVKLLCELTDHSQLVRQSPHWLGVKKRFFDSVV